MISVLLVEDHASYREALEAVMVSEGELSVVAHAAAVDDAAAEAARYRPDVALVDLDLPGSSGVDAIVDIRRASPGTACIVLSALNDDIEIGRSIEAGASAVIHKSVDIGHLLDVVRRVADGATVLPPQQTTRALRALARSRDQTWHARMLNDSLSGRELQVLERLADGLGNREIARELGIAPDTVQTHIRNLLAKLAVGSRLEAVVKALRLGLVKPPT